MKLVLLSLFTRFIIRLFQLVFSAGTVFFSHHKSANSVFQPAYQPSRTGPSLVAGVKEIMEHHRLFCVICLAFRWINWSHTFPLPLSWSKSAKKKWKKETALIVHPCTLLRLGTHNDTKALIRFQSLSPKFKNSYFPSHQNVGTYMEY
jgi:hypothetical protein